MEICFINIASHKQTALLVTYELEIKLWNECLLFAQRCLLLPRCIRARALANAVPNAVPENRNIKILTSDVGCAYKQFRAVNVVLHCIITNFKLYIRVITDFTPSYNIFFALYPIDFTVGRSGPS